MIERCKDKTRCYRHQCSFNKRRRSKNVLSCIGSILKAAASLWVIVTSITPSTWRSSNASRYRASEFRSSQRFTWLRRQCLGSVVPRNWWEDLLLFDGLRSLLRMGERCADLDCLRGAGLDPLHRRSLSCRWPLLERCAGLDCLRSLLRLGERCADLDCLRGAGLDRLHRRSLC